MEDQGDIADPAVVTILFMKPPRLYGEFARLWPLLSPPDDYAAEAGVIRDVLDGEVARPSETPGYNVMVTMLARLFPGV